MSDTFPVTESGSMLVRITLPQDRCQLTLMSPGGQQIVWDPTSSKAICGELPVQPEASQPPVGYIYSFSVAAPANGVWTIQVTTPTAATADWNSVLDVEFNSPLGIGLFPAASQIAVGKSVPVSLAVMDGFSPVLGYQCTAWLSREGDPAGAAQQVTFSSAVDPSTGASTPVAAVTPQYPGTYFLSVTVTGTTSAGSFERSAATAFRAFTQPAAIGGPMRDRVTLAFPKPLIP